MKAGTEKILKDIMARFKKKKLIENYESTDPRSSTNPIIRNTEKQNKQMKTYTQVYHS